MIEAAIFEIGNPFYAVFKDGNRLYTGIDPDTGKPLSSGEMALAAAGLIPGVATGKNIIKAGKTVNNISKTTKAGKAAINTEKVFVKNPYNTKGNLKPNLKYKSGEYNYLYETDDLGRINKFETDNLQLTTRKNRLNHNPNTPGKQTGDHAGHIAGDRFGGSPELDNLVSQSSNINLSQYKKLENKWANAIKSGKQVNVNVKIDYNSDSLRPSKFKIDYEIDGELFFENLLN